MRDRVPCVLGAAATATALVLASGCGPIGAATGLMGRANHLAPRWTTAARADGGTRELEGRRRDDGFVEFADRTLRLAVRPDPDGTRVTLEIANGTPSSVRLADGARLERAEGTTSPLALSAERRRRSHVGPIAPGRTAVVHACVDSDPTRPGRLWCRELLGPDAWVEGPPGSADDEAAALVGRELRLVLPLDVDGARREYHVRMTVADVQVTRRWTA